MRRVCEIDGLGAELEAHSLREAEVARQRQIYVEQARAVKQIEGRSTEAIQVSDRCEGRSVKPRGTRADLTGHIDGRFDDVRPLDVAGRGVQVSARRPAGVQ